MTGNETVFKLKEVSLQQAGKAVLWNFLPFVIGLIGSFAYDIFIDPQYRSIFFHLRNASIFAVVIYGITQLLNKKNVKDIAHLVLIKITDKQISIEIDKEIIFNGNINELKAIRTLELSNKKLDVQGQIYIGQQVVNLASSINANNKYEFDGFVKYCEKRLGMLIKPVPFSIFTHNFQGVKYVEYYNSKIL